MDVSAAPAASAGRHASQPALTVKADGLAWATPLSHHHATCTPGRRGAPPLPRGRSRPSRGTRRQQEALREAMRRGGIQGAFLGGLAGWALGAIHALLWDDAGRLAGGAATARAGAAWPPAPPVQAPGGPRQWGDGPACPGLATVFGVVVGVFLGVTLAMHRGPGAARRPLPRARRA